MGFAAHIPSFAGFASRRTGKHAGRWPCSQAPLMGYAVHIPSFAIGGGHNP